MCGHSYGLLVYIGCVGRLLHFSVCEAGSVGDSPVLAHAVPNHRTYTVCLGSPNYICEFVRYRANDAATHMSVGPIYLLVLSYPLICVIVSVWI